MGRIFLTARPLSWSLAFLLGAYQASTPAWPYCPEPISKRRSEMDYQSKVASNDRGDTKIYFNSSTLAASVELSKIQFLSKEYNSQAHKRFSLLET